MTAKAACDLGALLWGDYVNENRPGQVVCKTLTLGCSLQLVLGFHTTFQQFSTFSTLPHMTDKILPPLHELLWQGEDSFKMGRHLATSHAVKWLGRKISEKCHYMWQTTRWLLQPSEQSRGGKWQGWRNMKGGKQKEFFEWGCWIY